MLIAKTSNDTKLYTLGGMTGIFCWSLSGLLVSNIIAIPVFQVLSISLAFGFLFTSSILVKRKKWSEVKQPLALWIFVILGIYGNDLCYITASKYAPIAHVVIITFLWPILVVVLSSILRIEKFKPQYFISIILGLTAVYIALIERAGHVQLEYSVGYIFAFIGAISWSVYMIVSRNNKHVTSEFVGLCLGFGCIISVICHNFFETFVVPEFKEWLILCLLGILIKGSAYFLWDQGIKLGNFQLLLVFSYAKPIMAIIWLVLFGNTLFSSSLIISSILIVIACFIAKK